MLSCRQGQLVMLMIAGLNIVAVVIPKKEGFRCTLKSCDEDAGELKEAGKFVLV